MQKHRSFKENDRNSLTPWLSEFNNSRIDLPLLDCIKTIGSSLPKQLITPCLLTKDHPRSVRTYGVFNIREIQYTIWEKTSKRASSPKTKLAYCIEANGKYLVDYSQKRINQEDSDSHHGDRTQSIPKTSQKVIKVREWQSVTLEKVKESVRLFDYIKDAEIALANIISENSNELFEVTLSSDKCRDNLGRIKPEYYLKYAHLLEGGWYIKCADAEGNPIKYTQVKPKSPRQYWEHEKQKVKAIKYENTAEQITDIILPDITSKLSIGYLIQKVNERYNTNFSRDFKSYSEFLKVASAVIPIYITEGAKKTLSLISQGYLAIGLAGIWNFSHKNSDDSGKAKLGKTKQLKPSLVSVLFGAKEIKIAFDQDEKLSTKRQVNAAANAFKKSIIKFTKFTNVRGRNISILKWDNQLGKGIDDLFFNGYSLADTEEITSGVWEWYQDLNKLSNPDKNCNVRYISHILKTLHTSNEIKVTAVKSRQGTGKSWAVSNCIHATNKDLLNGNAYIVALSHRESLCRILASQLGIGYRTDTENQLSMFGIALCVDSLIVKFAGLDVDKLIDDLVNNEQKLYLIIDEVSQVLNHLFTAKTEIRKYRDQVILNLQKLLAHCIYGDGEIYLMDADLCDRDLHIMASLAGLDFDSFREFCYIIDNSYNEDIWGCTVFETSYIGSDGKRINGEDVWLDSLVATAKANELNGINFPIFLATTAQQITSSRGSLILGKYLSENLVKPVLTIDSDTLSDQDSLALDFMGWITKIQDCSTENSKVKLVKDFQEWLNGFSVVICSPSIETGISIPSVLRFNSVWGYCGGNNPVSNFIQSLCRVRFTCDRFLFVKDHGIADSESRGVGVTAKEKELNITQKNDNIRRVLKSAEFEIVSPDNLKQCGINFVRNWCLINESVDMGLLDPHSVIVNKLTEMGCQVSYYELPTEEMKVIEKKVKKQQIDIGNIKRGERIKSAKNIRNADVISQTRYLELKRKRSLPKDDKLAKQRFEFADKFGDNLLENHDGYLLIAGDLKFNIYSKLRREHILRNPDLANQLSLISLRDKTTMPDQTLPCLSDGAIALQYLGVFDLIDSGEQISSSHPLVKRVIIRWANSQEDVKLSLGVTLTKDYDSDPLYAIGLLLKPLGYKFRLCYKNDGDRRYEIIRGFTENLKKDQFNPVTNDYGGFIEYITPDQITAVQQKIASDIQSYLEDKQLSFTQEDQPEIAKVA